MPYRCRNWTIALLSFVIAFALCGEFAFGQQQGPLTSDSPLPMNAQERAWLDEHKNLRLGVWLSSPPIMFRGDDGSMQGIVPSYIQVIEKKLGLTPQRVRASSFESLWELAKAREVDVVPAVTGLPERAKDMLISEPYFYMPIVVVTRSDFPFISGLGDLNGRTVAVSTGHVPHLRMPMDYPGIVVMQVDSQEQGLMAVETGRADAFVGAEATVAYLSRKHGITNIRIAAITEYSYRLSVGIRKDWPILLTLINRALATITDQDRKNIHDYWTILRDGQWVERPQVWKMVGGISGASLIVVVLFIFWNRKLAAEIQKRKQAEKKFKKAHEVTQQVIESADVVIVGLDYAGHVRLLNRAGEVITGYKREELIGKNWFDVVVPKERFPYVWDEFSRLVLNGESGASDSFENPIITKNGEVRHIQWRNSVMINVTDELAVISFGADITHRLRAEEELRLTQFAIDNAAMGVLRIQPSGHIVYANRVAASMLGYTRSELKRKVFSEITSDITAEGWRTFWERLKYNQMLTFEPIVRNKLGVAVSVEVTAYYLLFKGTELAIAFFTDISERKRVAGLREDIEHMVQHDLRSPALAVQTLFTLFDRADNLTENQRELLLSVKQASQRMLRIIDMSRILYKMESGTYKLKPEPVDLLPVVESVIEELKALIRVKKLTMIVNLEGKPVSENHVFMIESEEILCYALLSNLLRNALEASPEGEPVVINFSTSDTHKITVHNMGVIPEEIREVFFNKYVTLGKAQGTGLGTYTSHLIATSLGGKIGFTTSEVAGTVITVNLPIKIDSDS